MTKNLGNKIFWEKYWEDRYKENSNAVWEIPFKETIYSDYQIFKNYFDEKSFVVDLGCGSGFYTKFLKEKYFKTIGVDTSHFAIKKAIKNYPEIDFKKVNFANQGEVLKFKEQIQDANVYLRGVLHQIAKDERAAFCEGIKIILGKKGYLFMNESITSQFSEIRENNSKLFNIPLKSNPFLPSGIDKEEILLYFPSNLYEVLELKKSTLPTSIDIDNGNKLVLNSIAYVIKKKG